ncbi:hypothetical protein L107_15392 [Cyanobium sp. Copco_Reservoir_LC18]|uniref:hypothetical protein n=1 Tax=Cyanobium sp. Copco_Reservoir_LC18 TaxID=1328305 RepID=UPI0016BBB34C|nr:hypothetical protein [Cyanobium sp. Copco_Reservoir_LC18]KAF0652284.1 hypothetical protein L107_15392 [Cyanobium sp. Copco_Reservoir_LC18]
MGLRCRKGLGVAGCRSLATATAVGLAAALVLDAAAAQAAPNGTWLSQPQIWYYASRQSLNGVMADIRSSDFKVVFLDVRKVSEAMQREAAQAARRQGLMPVVWVQSPQYRGLRIDELVAEARHGDGIQVDDHFFAHYSLEDFYLLRQLYPKPIFCSIQPFQASLVPAAGCNQLDVQCYSARQFQPCLKLADRLGAVVSLSSENTLKYRSQLGERSFNTFLWQGP